MTTAGYAVGFFSYALGASPLGEDPFLGEQAQPVFRLKQFTKAFHHFFQKLGTLSAFAFVVVIAFQVLIFGLQIRRRFEHRTDCLVFKNEPPA